MDAQPLDMDSSHYKLLMQVLYTNNMEMEQEGNLNQLCCLTASLMSPNYIDLCPVLLEDFFVSSFEIVLTVFPVLAEVGCPILASALARRRDV